MSNTDYATKKDSFEQETRAMLELSEEEDRRLAESIAAVTAERDAAITKMAGERASLHGCIRRYRIVLGIPLASAVPTVQPSPPKAETPKANGRPATKMEACMRHIAELFAREPKEHPLREIVRYVQRHLDVSDPTIDTAIRVSMTRKVIRRTEKGVYAPA